MTAVLFLTARNAHCGQRTFRLAWCHEHSAATVTELLQPQYPACGTLFQSNYAIRTSSIDGLFRRQLKAHPFWGSMNTMALCDFDMWRLRRTLTYLLTYLSFGIVCVILHLAVSVEQRLVKDTQTDATMAYSR